MIWRSEKTICLFKGLCCSTGQFLSSFLIKKKRNKRLFYWLVHFIIKSFKNHHLFFWAFIYLNPNLKLIKMDQRQFNYSRKIFQQTDLIWKCFFTYTWNLESWGWHEVVRNVCDVIVTVVGNGHGDMSSSPGGICWHPPRANTLGKGMNPSFLPPAMGK